MVKWISSELPKRKKEDMAMSPGTERAIVELSRLAPSAIKALKDLTEELRKRDLSKEVTK